MSSDISPSVNGSIEKHVHILGDMLLHMCPQECKTVSCLLQIDRLTHSIERPRLHKTTVSEQLGR